MFKKNSEIAICVLRDNLMLEIKNDYALFTRIVNTIFQQKIMRKELIIKVKWQIDNKSKTEAA